MIDPSSIWLGVTIGFIAGIIFAIGMNSSKGEKMEKQFKLSKLRCNRDGTCINWHYHEKDVQEFIRLLKEDSPLYVRELIDALAGDKLI
jgi:hypothetical protein